MNIDTKILNKISIYKLNPCTTHTVLFDCPVIKIQKENSYKARQKWEIVSWLKCMHNKLQTFLNNITEYLNGGIYYIQGLKNPI